MTNLPVDKETNYALDEFTGEQRRYVKWLAVPKPHRQPPTKKEFAENIGVSKETLRNWERIDDFWSAVYNECRDLESDRLPEVMNAMTKRALDGSVQSQKLWFEVMGFYRPEENLNVRMQQEQLVVVMDKDSVVRDAQKED